ncbi:hypothetical protein FACS1894180_1040 [Bacteroidia bacterium]|nr:hypothetical protein FACS1894180_1040 [Bacteroidia bacterium]
MKIFKTSFAAVFAALLFFTQNLLAVPAVPHPVDYLLPDGTTITVQLRGDEHVHWAETTDGYTLLRNSNGFFEYAQKDVQGDLILSGIRAKNVPQRTSADNAFLRQISKGLRFSTSQAAAFRQLQQVRAQAMRQNAPQRSPAIMGTVRTPLILVDFPGKPFTKTQTDFDLLCNQVGYAAGTATGSVHDYFLASSYNQLDFQVDVFGPFTMSQTIANYDFNFGGDPRNMAAEAAMAADAAGCDFSQYDVDNDGIVDGIHIIYAGYDQAAGAQAGDALWAHASYVWDLTLDGKQVFRYSCSSELRGTSGTAIVPIGVIAHELSHVFGLPDLYDTDYEGSGGQSVDVGQWDIMASGSWNNNGDTPPYHSAWCKIFLGWVTAAELNAPADITLPNPATQGVSYKINTETAGEYFLVENRQQQGWDAYIPSSGMLIYHVDENCIAAQGNAFNADPSHRGLYVKQAGCGINSNCPSNRNRDSYPYNTNNSFTDFSTPNALSWAGAAANKPITEIMRNVADKTVSFKFMGGDNPVCPFPQNIAVSNITTTGATVSWTAGGTETAWYISYKKQSDTNWAVETLTATPSHTFTGLDVFTSYNFRIRAFCGENDLSIYQGINFKTLLCENQCNYTLIANDSYGDGWNGSYLIFMQNGVETGRYSAQNHGNMGDDYVASSDTVSVPLCYGEAVEVYFVSGQYDSETSFSLKDADGNEFYAVNNAAGLPTYTPLISFNACVLICYAPYNLQTENITENGATITWNESGSATEWFVSCKESTASNYGSEVSVTSPSFSFSGLNPSTTYNVRMRGLCAEGGISSYANISFTTACGAVTTLPYTENFENYEYMTFPECWTRAASFDYYGYIMPFVVTFDTQILAFMGNTEEIAVMPQFQAEANTLQVSFQLQHQNYGNTAENFTVGVMSNPHDPASFVPVQMLTTANQNTWETFNVAIPASFSGYHYIAFRTNYSTTDCYHFLDNISVAVKPTCPQTGTPAASNITTNSATINWQAGDSETSWYISHKKQLDTDWNAETLVTGTPTFALTGLDSATWYDVRVRAFCGGTDYSLYVQTSFVTAACAPENQCAYTLITNAAYGDGWYNAALIFKQNGVEMGRYSASGYGSTFTVNLCAVPTEIYFVSGYYDYGISFSLQDAEGNELYGVTQGDAYNLSTYSPIFSFMPCVPFCFVPNNLQVANVTENAATITWNANSSATAWDLIIGTDTINLTTNAYTATNLTPATTYSVKVRTICTDGGFSNWTNAVAFSTPIVPQVPAALPYNPDFASNDGWTLLNADQTNKWFIGNGSLYISNNGGTTNTYDINYSSYVWAYRTLNIERAEIVKIKFDWKADGEGCCDYLKAYLIPAGVEIYPYWYYLPDGAIDITGENLQNHASFQSVSQEIQINAAGLYNLAFFWVNDGSMGNQPPPAIKNLSVNYLQTPPTVITSPATDVADVTATLNGTFTAGTETIIEQGYKYKKANEVVRLVSADGHLTNLTPNTEYQFFAYAVTDTYAMTTGETLTFSTTTTGIENLQANSISLYPNPAENELYITFPKFETLEKLDVEIYDVAGRRVETQHATSLQENIATINVSSLASGVYFVKVGNVTKKFVKK